MRLTLPCLLLAAASTLSAQQPQPTPKPTTAAEAPTRDTSFIDAQGTAHVTRIVPVPESLSRQSHYWLSTPEPDAGPPESLADRRGPNAALARAAREGWPQHFP